MSTANRLLGLVLLAGGVTAARADDKADRPLGKEYMTQVREATRELVQDLEHLQDVLVFDLRSQKERTLYRRADAALGQVLTFQSALKDGGSREELYKQFDDMDEKLHALFKAADDLGEKQRGLQRAITYLRASDDQLHYALSAGDTSEARKKKVIERQAHALAATARELHQTASYALGDDPGRGVLLADLDRLFKAADTFEKGVKDTTNPGDVKREFKRVNELWQKVTMGLNKMAPKENIYLLRGASRMDQLHERLYKLLEVEGERPQLIIRT